MKIHITTPKFQPISITFETEHEAKCMKVLACYDPTEDFTRHCEIWNVREIEVLALWDKLESFFGRLTL